MYVITGIIQAKENILLHLWDLSLTLWFMFGKRWPSLTWMLLNFSIIKENCVPSSSITPRPAYFTGGSNTIFHFRWLIDKMTWTLSNFFLVHICITCVYSLFLSYYFIFRWFYIYFFLTVFSSESANVLHVFDSNNNNNNNNNLLRSNNNNNNYERFH